MTTKTPEEKVEQPGADGLHQDDAAALDQARANEESDPRLGMMKRARETRAKEMGDQVHETPADKDGEGDDDADAGKTADEIAEDADKGTKDDAGTTGAGDADKPAAADDMIVEITVNGKAEKMTVGEAKKSLQLGRATEETLAQAKERREEANRTLEAAKAAAAIVPAVAPAAATPAEPTPAEKRAKEIDDAKAAKAAARKEHAHALQYGNEDEIAAAEKKLTEAEDKLDDLRFAAVKVEPTPAAPDPLMQRETVDTNRATKNYIEAFGEDQKDEVFRAVATMNLRKETIADLTGLGADPNNLAKLTDLELGEHHFRARSRGLVRTLDVVLTAAGTKAREELKRRSSPTPGQQNPRDERQQRKQDAPSQPRAAAGRVPEPQAPQPKTAQDLVAEARQRRGKA